MKKHREYLAMLHNQRAEKKSESEKKQKHVGNNQVDPSLSSLVPNDAILRSMQFSDRKIKKDGGE